MANDQHYDLLVVGGGINGAGIARDAAGRGLRVLLCEKDDLAGHTSSASTKLIHGGLRYLEYYEFGLVRKALKEREVLLRAAPHIIWPLRFVMPHVPHLRPAWMIRMGLFLYDHLSRRELLPGSCGVNLDKHALGVPLQDSMHKGFVYSDAWVDDARLVVLNAIDAQERGAKIMTRTKLQSAHREAGLWQATLVKDGQIEIKVSARAIVNAAGPWASELLHQHLHQTARNDVRLVKGSHIVVKKMFDHDHAYIFQNPDKRIIFAIPYEHEFTLIGTTDLEYKGDPGKVKISSDEVSYLCDSANRYFKQSIKPADVLWTYSGVRPLLEQEDASNPSAVTRDYHLELDATHDQAPILSVFGGKITTFRCLAEEAVNLFEQPLKITKTAWTANASLPGGDIPNADFSGFFQRFQSHYPWLPKALAERYAHSYGTRALRMLSDCRALSDLGEQLSPGLYEAEVRYLVESEWARTTDDILWRRSKLGLHATPSSVQVLQEKLTHLLAAAGQVPSAVSMSNAATAAGATSLAAVSATSAVK
ncbi:glycerol-3-phosphate dehydrogenase [Undibacterium jejuense]|uniref:Glycerol-3-phosphate dehydrogenase n=1 Tax=Undibacterium jejuense TaxID=1344949 RepID=A0A923KQK2_9BURK|nr:glycerol-3-phosphate dehydrogenase [Undibacterium jejuense]MBC3863968.1 glycerol-3-phosphate dehydrogenase [Undibacterium jejuense]